MVYIFYKIGFSSITFDGGVIPSGFVPHIKQPTFYDLAICENISFNHLYLNTVNSFAIY